MSKTTHDDQRKARKTHDVDKGFAWIVLSGSFVMYMLISGSFKAYGVLYTEMVEYYSSGFGNTAWIGTIALVLAFCLGPIANLLCRIYSFRRVTIIGGILLGLGYFLSGFVTRMEYMYLTFLSTGFGYGFAFAPCFTIISFYFDKRRALANGIVVSGSGIGTSALSFLYKYLIDLYGLKGTFWILGAIFANVCVAGCVFRQPKYLFEEEKENVVAASDVSDVLDGRSSIGIGDENSTPRTGERLCGVLDLRFSLFKNTSFTLSVLSLICCSFGYFGVLILVPANVKALGYDKTYVVLSVSILGGVEAVARIVVGWFADLKIIRHKNIYMFSMFIGGGISLLAPFFESFTFISVYAAVAAIFPGSFFSLMSVLIIDLVGLKNFLPAFGLLTCSLAVGAFASQPAIGWLYDLYGNWHSSYILTGCTFILAGALILLEHVVFRCCNKTEHKDSNSIEIQQESHDRGRSTDGACTDETGSADTSLTS